MPIYVGVNNIAFADYSTDIDFSKVTEISFWGSGDEGSAVITDCYLYGPVKRIPDFKNEIASLDGITSGQKFVIANADASKVLYFKGNVDSHNIVVESVPTDGYFYYQATKVDGLDTDNNGIAEDDNYTIQIFNGADVAFVSDWNWGSYLNHSIYGNTFAATAASGVNQNYGWDFEFAGIWKISKEEDGFVFQCAGGSKVYLKVDGTSADKVYLKLYESVDFAANTDLEKEENAANDEIFALADATGYNSETGEVTNGTWTFDTPVDLTDWDYLMITTINSGGDSSHEIIIKDVNDVTVQGDGYSGSTAGTGGNMWLDTWNNQNAIRISLDYLRKNKSMDISQIKSFKINGTVKVANVYLTDYNNTKINGGYCTGDVVREYAAYEIAGKTANGVTLTKVTGLLEAGKPYFYLASDAVGKYDGNTPQNIYNVNFFRADADTYDAASAGTNNGLIGTFSNTTAPIGADYYVLSNNKLYNVDSSVTVGANKAYVNISAITPRLARGFVDLDFNEPTGIETVANSQEVNANSKFFNLAGQRVAQPTKGLYIVNGKKVLVK